VYPVAVPDTHGGELPQHCLIGERPKKFEVAVAGLMQTCEEGINDAKRRFAPEVLACDAIAGPHATIGE